MRSAIVLVIVVGLLGSASVHAQTPTECIGDEGVLLECFVDVICPQAAGYEDVRRSVVHIYGPDTLATGVLINNAACTEGESEGDDCGVPYLLTAAHSFTDIWDTEITNSEIYSIENEFTFTLGYATPFCGGEQTTTAIAVGGCQVMGHSIAKDLILLRLDTMLPAEAGPYYAGWGANGGFNEIAAIGHPCGGPQKIALAVAGMTEFQPIFGVDLLHVLSWDQGGVLAGSSGGPLFADSGGLIGILSKQDLDRCTGDTTTTSFVALTSIVPFLGVVANGFTTHGAYDPQGNVPIYDVVTNDEYYGSGDVVKINATQKVTLYNGFHADDGSVVHVIIVPAVP